MAIICHTFPLRKNCGKIILEKALPHIEIEHSKPINIIFLYSGQVPLKRRKKLTTPIHKSYSFILGLMITITKVASKNLATKLFSISRFLGIENKPNQIKNKETKPCIANKTGSDILKTLNTP